jgi:hypothetical protein
MSLEFDPRQFSDAAVAALADAALADRLTPEEIIDWALSARLLPRQENIPATFGQPPVTVFRSRRFYVEALFWLDGSTSIHQHSFAGAFLVLQGSSIETRFSFEEARAFDGRFVLGTLKPISTALLRRGDVRPIVAGRSGLIHSLFHLERPSVTVVVRTFGEPREMPQFSFARPGIGHDPFYKEEALDRTLEIVTMLCKIDAPGLDEKLGSLVERSDLHTAYRVLLAALPLSDRALFDRLVEHLRDREAISTFRAAFEEMRRVKYLLSRRALVRDTDARFFLGVLLNAHRREDVLTLAQMREPEKDAPAQVAAWVRQLSGLTLKLQAGGSNWLPNVLGIPPVDDHLERALADSLAGRDVSGDAPAAAFLDALRSVPALSALFA